MFVSIMVKELIVYIYVSSGTDEETQDWYGKVNTEGADDGIS